MKPSQHTLLITPALAGERLDKALPALLPDITRSRLQSLLALGHVTLDGPSGSAKVLDGAAKVKPGQLYTVLIPPLEEAELKAQEIALDVVFEDAHLLIINKPPGMVVHPAPGNWDSTLVNALLAHCGDSLSGIGGVARPGLVHRIDKETSGLLVVAKHDDAYQKLSAQLAQRTLKRTYFAICHGRPVPAKGTITGNIGRHPHHRQKNAVLPTGGKHAVTHYQAREFFGNVASLVEVELETGRTHQIRVHFAHIKHPLVGDPVYGKKGAKDWGLKRQALHAARLRLIHPASDEAMQFEARLPQDLEDLLETLRKETA